MIPHVVVFEPGLMPYGAPKVSAETACSVAGKAGKGIWGGFGKGLILDTPVSLVAQKGNTEGSKFT